MIPSIRFLLRIRLAWGQRACNRFSGYANMRHQGAWDSFNTSISVIDAPQLAQMRGVAILQVHGGRLGSSWLVAMNK